MRRLYRERLLGGLRRWGPAWPLRLAGRWAAVQGARLLRRPLAGPILGTVVANYACNLRCRMCDLPLRVGRYGREGLRPLSTPEMLAVIDDFADLGTLGLGFTGGEPLLRDDLFVLLERSRRRGMITHLNTNGSLVTEEVAEKIVSVGVDSVNLSLDGATPETHDPIRARPGSFREVVRAVGLLRAGREAAGGRSPRIKLVCVLGPHNLPEAEGLLAVRREIGADAVDFLPLHDFDAPASRARDPILDRASPEEGEAARAVARRLRGLRRREGVENSPAHLALLPSALRGEPSPLRCHAGYNSLVVDAYGRIFPCVPWSYRDRTVGDVRKVPLARFWRSAAYAGARREIHRCRDCYLNCQMELNLLFEPPWRKGRWGRLRAGSVSSRSDSA